MPFSIQNNIQTGISSKKLDDKLINKPQQAYKNRPVADSFESSTAKSETKKGFWSKWGKTLSAVGCIVAATVGGILLKKNIDAKKAKELAEKAQQAAREQAEKARIEAERRAEEARIQAEKNKAERARQLEEQARLKAEKEAKLKAEKEAKALELEKLRHQEVLKKFDNYGFENIENPDAFIIFYNTKGVLVGKHLDVKSLLSDLETLEGKDNISAQELKAILQRMRVPNSTLEKLKLDADKEVAKRIEESATNPNYAHLSDKDKIKTARQLQDLTEISKLKEHNSRLENFINIIDNTPMNEGETSSQYLKRVISIHRTQKKAEYETFVNEMKRKATPTETMSEETFNELATHNNFFDGGWGGIAEYVGGGGGFLSQPIAKQKAVLETYPIFANKYDENICRYMFIPEGNMSEFLKSFEQEGQIYELDRIASCAKVTSGAEREFRDSNPDKNIKIIFHSKYDRPVFEARDIGYCKYGAGEAIYPPGQRFKYLGKIKHEMNPELDRANFDQTGKFIGDEKSYDPYSYLGFDRWEIHLQEI